MHISDVPDQPFGQLDDKTLLGLSRHWGKVGLVGLRRFLATLPEVERRGLYRRARCHTIYEYGSKYGGTSREVVDTVLLVHRRIGAFEILWGLFAQGKTGLSLFRRISRHVTADNAAWWADIVQSCTLREIEGVLAELGVDPPSGAQSGQLPLTGVQRTAEASHEAAAVADLTRPITGAGHASACPPGTPEVARPQDDDVPNLTAEVEMGRTAGLGSDRPDVRPTAEAENPEAPYTPMTASGSAWRATNQESVEAHAADPARSSKFQEGAGPRARSGAVALTPLATQMAEHLVAEYRRRGLTVSMAEVVEAALRQLSIEGVLPTIGGQEANLPEAQSHPEDEAVDRCAAGAAAIAGAAATAATSGAAATATTSAIAVAPATAAAPGNSGARVPLAAERPRRTRLPRVLVSLSEVGITFLRTVGGLIPLSQKEAEALDPGKPPISYPALVDLAQAAGERAVGRAIPGVVKLAICLRSAGKCEARGCSNQLEEFDHLDPYSEFRTHLPNRIAGLCWRCHRARHNGLFANPGDPPGQWRYLKTRSPRRTGRVDRRVQASRQRARDQAFNSPKASHAARS